MSFGLLAVAWTVAGPACSASGDGSSLSGGRGGASGNGAGGSINPTGGSSGVGTGGAGGSINPAGGSSGTVGVQDGGDCTGVSEQAENQVQPADIVIIVDNSGSMNLEAAWVQSNMNGFVQAIIGANIDAHVVLISNPQGASNGICIPQTLGSGSCPDDSNLPIYKHVNQEVGSTDLLQLAISQFPQYRDMLRAGATKHFVVVTDDNSSMPAATFDSQIRPLLQGVDPAFQGYRLHGIFAFTAGWEIGTPCFTIGSFAAGAVYKELVQMTGGTQGDLCLQDFAPVFAALSQNVIQGSGLACEWAIPPPPAGETLAVNQVNVDYTPTGGERQTIGYVNDPGQCGNVQHGWYYDNPTSPTKVLACPQTCSVIQQGGGGARIDIKFGCDQVIAPPK